MLLKVPPRSCGETSATCNDIREVMSIKVEEGTDTHTQPKEIPVCITFPAIKAEQDEVSYMSVCSLLDTFRHYPHKPTVLLVSASLVCPRTFLPYILCVTRAIVGIIFSWIFFFSFPSPNTQSLSSTKGKIFNMCDIVHY
jgi:hypothetical protein